MQTTTTAPTTVDDLAAAAFSPDEIDHLQALKAGYDPFREYCQSKAEYERLSFLKWRYAQGRIERG